jgi:hypothetical protein
LRSTAVFLLPLLLLLAKECFAQSVERVKGTEVLISIQGTEELSVGDQIQFLNDELVVRGQGEITKVSEGGKKALAKLTSGKALQGMSVEKSTPRSDEKSSTASSSKELSKDSEDAAHPKYLSEEDRRILRIGYIDTTRYVIGGILGTYPGLGIGHAVQGRYSDRGWIFTAGEIGSTAVLAVGAARCLGTVYNRPCDDGLLTLGVVGLLGFKIWEIIDVWVAPIDINRHYRELRRQPSSEDSSSARSNLTWNGMILPTKDGVTAGVRMTFQ